MTHRSNSAGESLLVSRNSAFECFTSALGVYVGRGRRFTAKEMERGTGIPARMIESFLAGPDHEDFRRPQLGEVLSLMKFLGPDFTSELIILADQGAFWLPDDETPPGELAADIADDNAVVTRAARDGVFDKDERRDLKIVGVRLVNRGSELLALGRVA